MELDVPEERQEQVRDYYRRDDVREAMVQVAANREIAPTYPWGYGARPDTVNLPGDLKRFVEDGAVAFHGSVERWKNPMLIDEVDPAELRTGWDLIMDIDCDADLQFAKVAAVRLLDELAELGVESASVKFSGNRGFHVGVRQECFPDRVQGKPLPAWYPELPRTIVSFLRDRLAADLSEAFVAVNDTVRGTVYDDDGAPTPYDLVDIENNWGDRHLFRLPYSVNEKSWLVSLPLEPSAAAIRSFEKEDAAIDAVTVDTPFLERYETGEAEQLVVEALDWRAKQPGDEERAAFDGDFDVPEDAIPEEYFPPTIHNILAGLEDGRKRAVFILVTFLQHVGYDMDAIEAMIHEWNERNQEPLDESYIRTQLNWHARQDEPLMPPNWDANGFYRDMQVYEEDSLTENTSNPVSYTFARRSDEDEEDTDGDDGGSDKPTMHCPYCGKEYQGETKWYRDHVRECQG